MKTIEEIADKMEPTKTWWSHSAITVVGAFPIAVGLIVLGTSGALAYSIGTTLLAGYFVFVREPRDKAKKQKEGTYKIPDPDKQNVSGQVDRQGDMLGPIAVCAGAWTATIAVFLLSFL